MQLALTLGNQRWRERRDSYRPAGETIRTSEYEIAPIADDTTPKAFVLTHHYAASYPAARFRFGLYRRGELAGVAVFSHPCRDEVLTNVFPGIATDSVELGRLVLLDEVPGNGETWFLARCFDLLRSTALRGVVSFSDPEPRAAADGRIVFAGHIGTIYQAFNARYLGRGEPQTLRLLPDGRVFHRYARAKIRARAKGWEYAAALLEAFGAPRLTADMDARAWVDEWVPRLTRPMRHRGNHKYAWALHRGARRAMPEARPYPKRLAS